MIVSPATVRVPVRLDPEFAATVKEKAPDVERDPGSTAIHETLLDAVHEQPGSAVITLTEVETVAPAAATSNVSGATL